MSKELNTTVEVISEAGFVFNFINKQLQSVDTDPIILLVDIRVQNALD